jgi:hypothetical protein
MVSYRYLIKKEQWLAVKLANHREP